MIRNRTALADYTIGCHADGHNLIVANPKRAEDEASLSVLLDKRGDLVECRYGNATLDELMEEFGRRGFSFEQSTLKSPKSRVATAVRRMAERGLAPPEDFYLGRHLLDIDNEHLPRRSRGQALDEASASLIAEKRWGEARPVLEHLVRVRPADAGARARLGLCLLELGESEAAESALSRASDKDPENPDFKWNLAAARHRNDRRGACYLALRDFQATADPHDPRRDEARVFLDEFERLAALHHPDTAPLQFAEAEVLVEQAKKLRAKHRTRAAVSCLETAVDMVPTMTSAWTQLGQLYLGKRAFAQAQDCFHRSLSINPGDMAATAGLAAANKGTRPRYRPGKRKS